MRQMHFEEENVMYFLINVAHFHFELGEFSLVTLLEYKGNIIWESVAEEVF